MTEIKTAEQILKSTFDHFKNVIKPDNQWADWETVITDGTVEMVVAAMEEYKSQSLPVDSNVEDWKQNAKNAHNQISEDIHKLLNPINVDEAAEKKYTILDLQEVWDAAKAGENVPILYGKIGSSRYKEKYPKLNDFLNEWYASQLNRTDEK